MKAEKRDVWVSDDGKVFETKGACEAHESEQLRRQQALAGLKVWSVAHGFDATEGRGYFASTYIITDATKAVLIQWCLDKFGAPLDSWYGDGFFETWHLNEGDMTAAQAAKKSGETPGYNYAKTKVAVVSDKDWTWAGLPASEFPWPRTTKKAQQEGRRDD